MTRPTSDADSGREENAALALWARRLSTLMDGAFRVPGTEIRIGLDPILGFLLPELGDALTGLVSLSLLVLAHQERVPKVVMARMVVNIALDALLGAVPLVGDLFDVGFRSNERNLRLIEKHRGNRAVRAGLGDFAVVAAAILATLLVVAAPIVCGALLLAWLFR